MTVGFIGFHSFEFTERLPCARSGPPSQDFRRFQPLGQPLPSLEILLLRPTLFQLDAERSAPAGRRFNGHRTMVRLDNVFHD
jgi:hypothetical protein